MPTIFDMMRSSFRCIGQLRPGFGQTPTETADGLFVLNAMFDGWQANELNAPSTLTANYTLGTAKQSYTIGPAGDFNGPRPQKIISAKYVVMTNPVQPLYQDLEVVNDEQFLDINLPLTASTIPQRLYYNTGYPLGVCTFWPVPVNTSDQVAICSAQFLAGNLTDATAQLVVPPGYLDAIRYNLAVRLSMEWDKPLKPMVAELASETLGAIQAMNAPTPQMDCNQAVMPIRSRRGSWNRLTGD